MDIPTTPNVVLRLAVAGDFPCLEEVRAAAFAPVFASFRSILGEDIYNLAQAPEDDAQGELLASLFAPESGWEVYAAELAGMVVGFVSVRLNLGTQVGEIGLNAVHPHHAGKGVGTAMYEFAIARMKEAGMRVATVATGADPSHAPARRAYEKAGFTVQIPSVWLCRKL
jgi:GNAT superfamily N-acetyltransferase